MGLHDGRGAIHVHYQPGKEIAFAVHQTVSVVVGTYQIEHPAQPVGLGKAPAVKILIYHYIFFAQHSHGYATHLVMARAEKLSGGRANGNGLALLQPFGARSYGA